MTNNDYWFLEFYLQQLKSFFPFFLKNFYLKKNFFRYFNQSRIYRLLECTRRLIIPWFSLWFYRTSVIFSLPSWPLRYFIQKIFLDSRWSKRFVSPFLTYHRKLNFFIAFIFLFICDIKSGMSNFFEIFYILCFLTLFLL